MCLFSVCVYYSRVLPLCQPKTLPGPGSSGFQHAHRNIVTALLSCNDSVLQLDLFQRAPVGDAVAVASELYLSTWLEGVGHLSCQFGSGELDCITDAGQFIVSKGTCQDRGVDLTDIHICSFSV